MAIGKPVVISDMPNFIELPAGFVYRAQTAQQFVEMVRLAHDEDCEAYRLARLEYAKSNTWRTRGDFIKQEIDKLLTHSLNQRATHDPVRQVR
jgi:hypothetical protein